jgi:hypothetical protein
VSGAGHFSGGSEIHRFARNRETTESSKLPRRMEGGTVKYEKWNRLDRFSVSMQSGNCRNSYDRPSANSLSR